MVLASCGTKYFGTNFIDAVPTSLLIVPGLRTIQFLFLLPHRLKKVLVPMHATIFISHPCIAMQIRFQRIPWNVAASAFHLLLEH
jgi:hypothetical protein